MQLDTIACGHILDITPQMLAGCVHCSCTSPPYYGLRKYAGDQVCDWPEVEYAPMPGLLPIHVEAWRGALGHEPAIEMYVGHLVAVYREVWRVLRDDGVAWIVMGDSYAANRSYQVPDTKWRDVGNDKGSRVPNSLNQGDLMLVPHRLALALQADGWTVRNDCPWAKKAPMPESVAGWRWQRHRIKVKKSDRATNPYQSGADTKQGAGVASRAQREAYYEQGKGASKWQDCPGCPKCEATGGYVLRRGSWRHTRAHEFVFMLSKSMQYWSDQEAVREAAIHANDDRKARARENHKTMPTGKRSGIRPGETKYDLSSRNPRSVLSPPPEPFSGKHFAVYPTGLIELLIKATCPARCCPECGRGWSPVVERETCREHGGTREMNKTPLNVIRAGWRKGGPENNILGYRPTCGCGRGDHIPGVVFDPFMGAGTTAVVAVRLGLRFCGCDISRKYIGMAMDRVAMERDRVEEERVKAAQMEMTL